MNRKECVNILLAGRPSVPRSAGRASAPANIALCKYWGKRDAELNLPVTSSLSVSLGELGAETEIARAGSDEVWLNGEALAPDHSFTRRAMAFLDLFRPEPGFQFALRTRSTVPVAAGLASSASGFAALVRALDDLFGWGLDRRALSILARMGSGSAARSVYEGFVEWHAGSAPDGMDSFAEPLPEIWPGLRIGLLLVSKAAKPIGSRDAMNRTVATSALYRAWPEKVSDDLLDIREAIRARDFDRLGRSAESNALAMHATMAAAWPPVVYWTEDSVRMMHRIWALRAAGLPVYFTMDAGPNLKLLYEDASAPALQAEFPELVSIRPFGKH